MGANFNVQISCCDASFPLPLLHQNSIKKKVFTTIFDSFLTNSSHKMAGTASPRSSPPPAAAAWLLWGLFCLFCALDWGFASVYSALLALRVTALVIDETM